MKVVAGEEEEAIVDFWLFLCFAGVVVKLARVAGWGLVRFW